MSIALIAEIRTEVFQKLTDGKVFTWPELVQLAPEEHRPVLDTLAFGKPDTVQRVGKKITAKAATGAQLPPFEGFTAYADKEVSCVIHEVKNDEMVVSDISGFEAETPIGLRVGVSKVIIRIDPENGNFLITATKFLVLTATGIISPKGKYLGWRWGK